MRAKVFIRTHHVIKPEPQQRVTIGRRIDDRLDGDVGAGAGPVLDDDLLAEPLRQPRGNNACDGVGTSARRKAHDPAHRPHRIGLRPRDARRGWQRGSARCEMEKISTGKFHGVASLQGGDATLHSALSSPL
jgi:hypothetical protein